MLTAKQKAFVLAYLQTGDAASSYRQAYQSLGNPNTCKVEAYRLLRNPKISAELARQKALVRGGMTVEDARSQATGGEVLAPIQPSDGEGEDSIWRGPGVSTAPLGGPEQPVTLGELIGFQRRIRDEALAAGHLGTAASANRTLAEMAGLIGPALTKAKVPEQVIKTEILLGISTEPERPETLLEEQRG
jgi:hypothetical protein